MRKLLDAGSGGFPNKLTELFPECEIIGCDIDASRKPDFVHDVRDPLPDEHKGIYDVVMMSHVMEHINRDWVLEVLKNMVEALKPGGELYVLVPDMEWAAQELLKGHDNEWEFHRCGFTLNALAVAMSKVGLEIIIMEKSPITITHGDKIYDAQQVQVTGRKIR
jgi:predicted SAM-dependent methyltransferase